MVAALGAQDGRCGSWVTGTTRSYKFKCAVHHKHTDSVVPSISDTGIREM